MNGQSFGALASGLSGGYGLGKSIKGALNKPEQPKLTAQNTAPAVQQGAQQTLGAADVTMPQLDASAAGFNTQPAEQGGLMSKLGGWLSETPADFGMTKGGGNGQ